MDDMGGVIPFKHEHQLEVIAEVVLAQSLSQRQVLLVESAGYTTNEPHFRLVIEPYAVQRFDEGESIAACLHL